MAKCAVACLCPALCTQLRVPYLCLVNENWINIILQSSTCAHVLLFWLYPWWPKYATHETDQGLKWELYCSMEVSFGHLMAPEAKNQFQDWRVKLSVQLWLKSLRTQIFNILDFYTENHSKVNWYCNCTRRSHMSLLLLRLLQWKSFYISTAVTYEIFFGWFWAGLTV